MDATVESKLSNKMKAVRGIQLSINKKMIEGQFRIPIHLAIGHEAVAVCLAEVFRPQDKLLLTHRNIHFHLAFGATEEQLTDEYLLKPSGLASGKLGSMNLVNPKIGNIYTSNILGNNFPVAIGIALAIKMKKQDGIVWVITGDGAVEEGSFYEAVLFASSLKLPIVFVIENNQWSLGTNISERRVQIDLDRFASSLNVDFQSLKDNNIVEYFNVMSRIREVLVTNSQPYILEIEVNSLGGYHVTESEGSERFINYHSGAIRTKPVEDDIFEHNTSDPIFAVLSDIDKSKN